MLLQNISILLKLDNFVSLDWREVFWGIWILLSMLAGQVLVLTLLGLSNCDILINKRNYSRKLTTDCKRCFFTLFSWISSSSLLLVGVNLIINLFRYLDKDVKTSNDILNSCYMLEGWFFFVFVNLLIFRKGLR